MRILNRQTRNRILTLALPVLGWLFLVSCETGKPRTGERPRALQTAEIMSEDLVLLSLPPDPSVYVELLEQDLDGDGDPDTKACVATPWAKFRVRRGGRVWFVAVNANAKVEIARDSVANGGNYNTVQGGANEFEVPSGTSRSITTKKWKTLFIDKWDASLHDLDLYCYDTTYTSSKGDHWRPAVSPTKAVCPTCEFAIGGGGPQMEVDD